MPRFAASTVLPLVVGLLLAAPLSLATESPVADAAIAEDDECQAPVPGGGASDGGGCSLGMLQLHGRAQTQAASGSGVHAMVWTALERVQRGLKSSEDVQAEGSNCTELMQSVRQCLPQVATTSEMTMSHFQKMCGCTDEFEQLKACPNPVYQSLADMELKLLGSMCSACGQALAELSFNAACIQRSPSGQGHPLYENFCGSECHPGACSVLSDCTDWDGFGGLIPPSEIAAMKKNITGATAKCACSSL